jgi:spermidine/putrescine transport system permease protein
MSAPVPAPLRLLGWATLGFIYLPLVMVAVFSFNAARQGYVWQGFSTIWYRQLFTGTGDPKIPTAACNTLILAVASTAISTVLGTGLALALRAPWTRLQRHLIESTVLLPVVVPDIILAACLVALRQSAGFPGFGMGSMLAGHVTLQISFVALVVHTRLVAIGDYQEEAARDLYASSGYVLRRVLLPQLVPAIVAGAMLAFTLSIDDYVISHFTAGPVSQTLPLFIKDSLRRGLRPEVHALSTLILLATMALVLVSLALSKPKEPT